MKKQRQMELRKGLPMWALEATVWGLMVLMVCPMALATMAVILVMARLMEYGRDL